MTRHRSYGVRHRRGLRRNCHMTRRRLGYGARRSLAGAGSQAGQGVCGAHARLSVEGLGASLVGVEASVLSRRCGGLGCLSGVRSRLPICAVGRLPFVDPCIGYAPGIPDHDSSRNWVRSGYALGITEIPRTRCSVARDRLAISSCIIGAVMRRHNPNLAWRWTNARPRRSEKRDKQRAGD